MKKWTNWCGKEGKGKRKVKLYKSGQHTKENRFSDKNYTTTIEAVINDVYTCK